MPTLEEAIEHIRMGNRDEGRQVLEEILETNESDEEVWLWLSSVVDTDEDREICLENVLALDPDNVVARKGLEALQAGSFDVNDMLSEVLDAEEEPSGTFIDEFVTADEFDEFDLDDDLTLPSTMQDKGSGIASKINLRVIILLTIVLLAVLVALGGAAFFLSGGGSGGDGLPAATLPAQGAPSDPAMEDTPTPTITPTPGPTDTPTHTPTPVLQLPTSVPTKEPTPTATRVVSPTPSN